MPSAFVTCGQHGRKWVLWQNAEKALRSREWSHWAISNLRAVCPSLYAQEPSRKGLDPGRPNPVGHLLSGRDPPLRADC